MKPCSHARPANIRAMLAALALAAALAGSAVAAPPSATNDAELLGLGFKVLVATTPVQTDWVKRLKPGQMRPMQRNGKHFYVYPDAARHQIYVGGPREYQAYRALHPDDDAVDKQRAQIAANQAYRGKQNDAMQKATARDLSDPFLGASWADLGW
jgi:hypothetical protein